jgi:hypothetical protein
MKEPEDPNGPRFLEWLACSEGTAEVFGRPLGCVTDLRRPAPVSGEPDSEPSRRDAGA